MPGSGTNSQMHFAQVPGPSIQRSAFDRSHGLKTAFDFGQLIPIFVDEALPGDTLTLRLNSFGRLATMIHPIMENLYLDFHFFAIPNRLVWDNWQKMMGEQTNPGDSIDYKVPQVNPGVAGFGDQDLGDYFGLPTKIASAPQSSWPSALPFRSYLLCWNTWYRDENLQNSMAISKGDGPDIFNTTNFPVLRRGKRHDYFTSALPFAQKGNAVSLKLGDLAPVVPGNPLGSPISTTAALPLFTDLAGARTPTKMEMAVVGGDQRVRLGDAATAPAGWTSGDDLRFSSQTGLVVNLGAATAATINTLRESIATQQLLERDARGGTRYTEILRSHFGVVSPDARLQRPEYLGGGTTRFNVNPVASTFVATTAPAVGIGTLGAFGTVSSRGIGFHKSFTEHCVLLGFVSGRADLNYQQGIERMWSRRNRYDFYWPEFANLGEQPVKNKEIFQSPSSVLDTGVDEQAWGFQERYAEYRYKPSRVTGRMRSNTAGTAPFGTLESWHLAQDFATLPVLNSQFIQEAPDVDRVLVVETGEPEILLDLFFSYRSVRPMPVYSVPGLRRL